MSGMSSLSGWLRLALLCGAAACGPAGISGSIDGERISGARDAVWDDAELDLGPIGEWETTTVLVSNLPSLCEVLDELSDADGDCEERCDRYLEIADEFDLNLDRYYILSVYANTSEGDDGEFEHDGDLGEGEFDADFSIYDATYFQDLDACEEACKDNEIFDPDGEDADDGELDLGGVEDDFLRGQFDIEFGGGDRLQGSFRASQCDLNDWL